MTKRKGGNISSSTAQTPSTQEAANPAHAVFNSKLMPTERTDIAYAITFPTGTIMKILLLQVMLSILQ